MSKIKKALVLILAMTSCFAFAREEYRIVVSMQTKNVYGINGKHIAIYTVDCNEFAASSKVVLAIDDMDHAFLYFSNGKSCKVENIHNILKEPIQ